MLKLNGDHYINLLLSVSLSTPFKVQQGIPRHLSLKASGLVSE